jgi:LacI family transcriptional regulator
MTKSASISDVARAAGVSIATVSRVVNGQAGKASPATVQKVQAAIAACGYRPTGAGQALRKGRSRLVAVIAANLGNPTMAATAASIEVALRAVGLTMVLCDSHDQPALQDEYLQELRAQAARAIILLGAVASAQLVPALGGPAPLLFVNRRCPGRAGEPFIGIDNRAAGAAIADALVARVPTGALAVIHASRASSATEDRVAGFLKAAERHGRRVIEPVTDRSLDHLAIGHGAMVRLLQATPPGAVFCASDLIAFGAHRALRDQGLEREVVLFGFDDNPLNDWIAPWLSSVRVPYQRYGQAIVAMLGQLWRGEAVAPLLLPFDLVER